MSQVFATRRIAAVAMAALALIFAIALLERAARKEPVYTPEQLRLREMIGQMLIIGFPGTSPAEEWPARVAQLIADGKIGGVLLLGHNVRSPLQLQELTRALAAAKGAPKPFIAVDQEGGAVQRLTPRKGFSGSPSAQAVAIFGPSAAASLYARQARELFQQGINVNFGPVVDLDVNADNPIISRLGRSYGGRPETVMPLALAFIEAHLREGVLTAAKHFPGHGSSTVDPHFFQTDVTATWTRAELRPFELLAAKRGCSPMIMVGHLVLKGFSDGDAPTSLSRRAVTDILRHQLGFEGLIVTDDLEMEAVRGRYGIEESFVRAAAAGNDLLIAANKERPDADLADRATAAIADAVEQGRISRSQIEASHARIIAAKRKLGSRQPDACMIAGLSPFSYASPGARQRSDFQAPAPPFH